MKSRNINIQNKLQEIIDSTEKLPCPYLSTIRKHLLDFDFEKVCSVTLSHTNIYCCLVCGRYYQGRSPQSPAFQHSIEFSHHVFINLQNSKFYCLPDNYEIDAYTLDDIKSNIHPEFTEGLIEELQKFDKVYYSIDAKQFIPGVVGINNLGKTDFATSVMYVFNSIDQIRRYFILHTDFKQPILSELGLLLKKMWNPKNLKGIVSPHEFLQLVSDLSKKQFKIGCHSQPNIFFLWLLDVLKRNIQRQKDYFNIKKLFIGKLKISFIKGIKDSSEYESIPTKIEESCFTILKLDFPEQGIFNKSQNKVELEILLEKYLGKTPEKYQEGLRYVKITDFPQYLILVYKRFTFNGYSMQKDATQLVYREHLEIKSSSYIVNYRLKAQICHEGEYEKGTYRSIFEINKNWFQVENLNADRIPIQEVELAQPLIQIYRLIK